MLSKINPCIMESSKQRVDESMDTFSEEVQVQVPDGETLLSLSHQVRHQVAVPKDYAYVPIAQHKELENPAREYPFKLDPFQRVAISCIERSESVLVSAHTSAGKTVVAEYAIAMSLRNKQRVIYTSPIKALSNQKYRELSEEFEDVGLMTGDVTLNPTASCLVMTTEILRSMLYRGSEVMREVAWVIFDEIHYMRDKERGVVWEETIIMLPNAVHYVFLSATIPNALQFADWICYIHEQPCHVVYTDYRPTPLQHYLFPAGGDGIHLVVDEKSNFREDNFQKAVSSLVERGNDPVGGRKKRKSGRFAKGQTDLYKIVKMIMVKNNHPVIVFSFSRRDCEGYALQMSKIDFNSEEERQLVDKVFSNAIESLSEDDRTLPQIDSILPLLRRGIGIHHSGLLPILKEVIEILFQEGLIKVLFATETFSIGLNMPAKTVVFTSVRKFDGKDFRWVSSGEYIQMSGRAGRRGLDDRGIVILMMEEKMEPSAAKNMLKGNADRLDSAFYLSYNMVLNLMRVEGFSPEYMLEKSFFQFQNNCSLPALEADLEELMQKKKEIVVQDETQIAEYHLVKQQLEKCKEDYRKVLNHQSYALPFMQPGRLVRIRDGEDDYGWGVVVNIQKKVKKSVQGQTISYIVDTLAYCKKKKTQLTKSFEPAGLEEGEMIVIPITLSVIDGLSSVRIKLPKELKSEENRTNVYKTIEEIKRRFPDGLPLLDPITDMGIEDEGFSNLLTKISTLETKLSSCEAASDPQLDEKYKVYTDKLTLLDSIKALKKHIKDTNSILQMDELKNRKRVLRRLGYCNEDGVIEMKGRVACEISTGDELLLTEMIFNGAFNDISVDQCVALLSCFVFEEKSDENSKLKEELAAPLRMMRESAQRIAKVSIECKLNVDEEDYVNSFRPELMDVVYAWCKGAKFSQLCKLTEVFEGSIIRCMRRLEELLRQMCQAAKSIGNTDLENKFAEGINKIKRDIVFANSLYL